MRLVRAVLLAVCCLQPLLAGAHAMLKVVTEDAPPFNFISGQRLQGPAPHFVEKVLRHAGLPFQHRVYPWARSMALATHQPNVLIYSLARTPAREAQFHWLGRLGSERVALYTQASRHDLHISTLAEAASLRIGTSNQDVRGQWLREQGFAEASVNRHAGLDVADNMETNLRRLQLGWIDAVPISAEGLQMYCRRELLDCRQFRQLLLLPLTLEVYLAASLGTPPATLARLRHSYQALVRDGSFARAFRGYQ